MNPQTVVDGGYVGHDFEIIILRHKSWDYEQERVKPLLSFKEPNFGTFIEEEIIPIWMDFPDENREWLSRVLWSVKVEKRKEKHFEKTFSHKNFSLKPLLHECVGVGVLEKE